MFKTLQNAWKIPELRKKLIFTMMILLIYRLGSVIPLPYVDTAILANYFDTTLSNTILGLFDAMSGSAFSRATVLALGIQPYINASIIIQLLTIAIPALERMAKDEGEEGKKKLERITRYTTVGLGLVLGFGYIVYYFVENGFTLGLNIVNMIFLFLGLLLHGDLRRYVDAISDAAAGAAGILLQFPFYAGIMGLMVAANDQGVSLASVISEFFVSISTNVTFPMLSFLAAGVVNFFVPSGGGQWAVQGPIMMPAGAEMGIEAGRTAMAIAWGDQWTNMIQPFWALPALGIAKLSARDIMGYLVIVLLFTGAVACLGFLGWALLF